MASAAMIQSTAALGSSASLQASSATRGHVSASTSGVLLTTLQHSCLVIAIEAYYCTPSVFLEKTRPQASRVSISSTIPMSLLGTALFLHRREGAFVVVGVDFGHEPQKKDAYERTLFFFVTGLCSEEECQFLRG